MKISVVEPLSKALEHTLDVCFRPFDLQKWLGLGFCAWLTGLGSGGSGGGSFNPPSSGGSFDYPSDGGQGVGDQDYTQALDASGLQGAFADVMGFDPEVLLSGTVIALSVAFFFVMIIIGLVVAWVSSRGHFMFIDGVVNNRGDVVAPWKEFKEQGASLFKVNLGLFFAVLVTIVLGAGAMIGVIVGLGEGSSPIALAAMTMGVGLIFKFMLDNFVVPTMYLRRVNFSQAWPVARQEVISGNMLPILLFWCMNVALGLGVAVVALMVTCLTCCLAALPYVGSVIMLPVLVFLKSYSLFFFEEFGPQCKLFPDGDGQQDALGSW
jgi:hypothetical protein